MNTEKRTSAPSTVNWLVWLLVAPLIFGPALAAIAAQAAAGVEFLKSVPMWAWMLTGAGYLACVAIAWRRGVLTSLPQLSWRPVIATALAAVSAGTILSLGGHLSSLIPSLANETSGSVPKPGTTGALVENIVGIMPVLFGLILVSGAVLAIVQISGKKK